MYSATLSGILRVNFTRKNLNIERERARFIFKIIKYTGITLCYFI